MRFSEIKTPLSSRINSFNSLYEIQINLQTTMCSCMLNFQFSLWDSHFSSLMFICLFGLSILFMRFIWVCPLCGYRQYYLSILFMRFNSNGLGATKENRTFNSLYEILLLKSYARNRHRHLSILFMRFFQRFIVKQMEKWSFNSLYEIQSCRLVVGWNIARYFQFSLWDSWKWTDYKR